MTKHPPKAAWPRFLRFRAPPHKEAPRSRHGVYSDNAPLHFLPPSALPQPSACKSRTAERKTSRYHRPCRNKRCRYPLSDWSAGSFSRPPALPPERQVRSADRFPCVLFRHAVPVGGKISSPSVLIFCFVVSLLYSLSCTLSRCQRHLPVLNL